MLKTFRKPNIGKTVVYAIAVNALQIVALLFFVVYVFWMDFSWQNRLSLRAIAVIGALVAGWGAVLDIQEALATRRRMRTIAELQTVNRQMDALNLKLRAQRHDFLNHLQVVYSLMEMGEYQDATAYLETVYSQLHAVSRVLRTKVTAFNALLQVKNAECEQRGILLELDVRSTLEGIAMPAWELCCVIGNLLDNAMDAAAQAQEPRISLSVSESLREFAFTIRNNGAAIPADLRERIFEPGFSTKGENRGMGLAIVRRRLKEYGGRLLLESGDEATIFTVFLPHGNGLAPKTE